MTQRPAMTLTAVVLDSPDAGALADFYQRVLGWPVGTDEPGWVTLRPPGGGAGLSFQTEDAYVRPAWPASADDQQMMLHLDIEVHKLVELMRRSRTDYHHAQRIADEIARRAIAQEFRVTAQNRTLPWSVDVLLDRQNTGTLHISKDFVQHPQMQQQRFTVRRPGPEGIARTAEHLAN